MGMNGLDFVQAICRSLNDMDKEQGFLQETGHYPIHKFVTHVVYVRQGSVFVPVDELEVRLKKVLTQSLGVKCVPVDAEYPKPRLNEHRESYQIRLYSLEVCPRVHCAQPLSENNHCSIVPINSPLSSISQ